MRTRIRLHGLELRVKPYKFETNGKMTYGLNILGLHIAIDLD